MAVTERPQNGPIRRSSKWYPACAVFATETLQNTTDPATTLGAINHHLHTAAYWSLGFQLLALLVRAAHRALNLGGSINVTWGNGGRSVGMSEPTDNAPAAQSPAAVGHLVTAESDEKAKHAAS
ncbi:hypothetical protein [Streptomyces capoamus]|uniref:hypothetical protein n=1 Tax=Streptomyces capoamus TaxID=68183 RepID=UPI003398A01A